MKIYALTLLLLLHSSVVLAFGDLDVKTVEDLFVMSERDLSIEAARGCERYQWELLLIRQGERPPAIASSYLTRIGMVLMQQGKLPLPDWYTDTQLATLGKDLKACYTPCLRLHKQEELRLAEHVKVLKERLRAQRAQKR